MKTSSDTGAVRSASSPPGSTCRLSSVKPFTANSVEPGTDSSIAPSGVCSKRHRGMMPVHPSGAMRYVVVPDVPATAYETVIS